MSLDANDWFAQKSYHCRLDWGQRGALAAAARGDVLVVVDVLRFSTTAATIIARGGSVVLAEWEAGLSSPGPRQSLSLLAYTDLSPGTTVPLASPNGATCARVGGAVPCLLIGALVNAAAVARAAAAAACQGNNAAITVLACGERWESPDVNGDGRWALEDYLGAGAVLSFLPPVLSRSPEAAVCEAAFRAVHADLENVLLGCGSGIELIDKGHEADVRDAARLNRYDAAPVLLGQRLVAATT